MARLYGNENLSLRIVEVLRQLGHDVLTSQEAGNANQGIEDDDVLAFACSESRIVVTNNRKHFIRLHRSPRDHAGILVYTIQPDSMAIAQRIDVALRDPRAQGRFLARVDGIAHSFDPPSAD